MTDAKPTRAARESAVGEQRDFAADRHSLEHARQRQHLAHPRTAARTFTPHYYDFAGTNAVGAHRSDRRLFVLEDARRTTKGQLVLLDGADFDHRAAGSEIAEENAE